MEINNSLRKIMEEYKKSNPPETNTDNNVSQNIPESEGTMNKKRVGKNKTGESDSIFKSDKHTRSAKNDNKYMKLDKEIIELYEEKRNNSGPASLIDDMREIADIYEQEAQNMTSTVDTTEIYETAINYEQETQDNPSTDNIIEHPQTEEAKKQKHGLNKREVDLRE